MSPTCECALLHTEPAIRSGCQECGTFCCPTCAIEIETKTYCRWCAMGLTMAVPA